MLSYKVLVSLFFILAMLRKTREHELTFYKYDYFSNFVYTPVEYEGLLFLFFFLMSGSSNLQPPNWKSNM